MNSQSRHARWRATLLGTAGAILFVPAISHAQTAPANPTPAAAGSLDEIVITARRRSESLQSVPVTVTAMTEKDIARYGVTNLGQIADQVPTVFISKTASGTGGVVSIRGIGTSPGNGGFEASVSVNADGVQVSRGRIATQSFFDIQQVEVLKGPQALFFGKNSPSGVISLTSIGPSDTFEGYARASYEFVGDEPAVEGAVSGPVTDTLGVRLAVRARNMDGYLRNNAKPLANPFAGEPPGAIPGAYESRPGEREFLGRLTAKWTPSDRFDATLKVFASRYRDDGPAAAGGQTASCGTARLPETGGVLDPYGDCNRDNQTSNSVPATTGLVGYRFAMAEGGKPYGRYDGLLTSLNMRLNLADALSVTSTTGYYHGRGQYFDNYGADALAQKASAELDNYKALSEELRLQSDFSSRFNFMAGLYIQSTELYFANVSKVFALGVDPATGRYVNWDKVGTTDGQTISVFGQGTFDITDKVELSGGLRWTKETKDSTLFFAYAHPALVSRGTLSTKVLHPDFEDTNLSPEITLSYHPRPQSTIYGAYKTGYKSGGANLSALVTPVATDKNLAFGPEQAEGFEIGAKGDLFDSRLRLNVSIYSYTFKDLQVSVYDTIASTFVVTNAARVSQRGVDIDAKFVATDSLTLRGALSYNRNRFEKYFAQCYAQQTIAQGCIGGLQQNLAGRPTARSPDTAGNFGATFETPLSNDIRLGLTADAYYNGGYYASETQAPGAHQDSFWRLDASARISLGNWEIAALGRNLTNEYYLIYLTDKPGTTTSQQYGTVSRGRELSVQATYRF